MSGSPADSRLYRALSLTTELVVLNLVLVLTSLPLVTAGAGLAACVVSCLRIVQGTGGSSLRNYFAAWRRGFLPATIGWLATLALTGLLVWEWLIAGQLISAGAALAIRAVLLLVGLLVCLVSIWFWPLLAIRISADESVRLAELLPLARTALLASIKYLPRSLLGVVIVALPLVIGLFSVEIGARLLIWFGLIGWALASYLVVLVLRRPLGIELPADD